MNQLELLKTLAQIAGIGGIAFGVLFLLFRDVISNSLKKSLPPEKAYELVRLIIIFTFSVSIIGLLGYFYISIKTMDNKMSSLGQELESTKANLQAYKDSLSGFVHITEKSRYSNIQEFENNVVLDLSGWQKITDEEKKNKIKRSIGQWHKKIRLAKVTEDVRYYYQDAATSSGIEPIFSCQTHKFKFSENKDANRVGGENLKRYLIDIDISGEPPQKTFNIEYTQVYYNSFQGETQDWAAVPINNPTQKIVFEILFPPNKPFKNYTLLAYPDLPNQSREKFSEKPVIEADPSGKKIKWTISNPRLRYIYRINWDW